MIQSRGDTDEMVSSLCSSIGKQPEGSKDPGAPLSKSTDGGFNQSSRIFPYIDSNSTMDQHTGLLQSVLTEESFKKPARFSSALWTWIFLSADEMHESRCPVHALGKCFACGRQRPIHTRITVTHRASAYLEEWMRECLEVPVDADRTTDRIQQLQGNCGSCCAKKIRAHFLKGAFLKQHLMGEWALPDAHIVRAWEQLPAGV